MRILSRSYFFSIVILLSIVQILGKTQLDEDVEISNVKTSRSISCEVEFYSHNEQLIIPYCGEMEGGILVLCSGAAHLEKKSTEGWQQIKTRWNSFVMGGLPQDKWHYKVLMPNERFSCIFKTSLDLFDIKSGDRLRLIIDIWKDEQSMRTNKPSMKFTSKPFNCP